MTPSAPPVAGEAAAAVTQQAQHATKWLDKGVDWLLDKGPGVIGALVLLIVGWIIAGWVRRIVIAALGRAKADLTLSKFVGNLAKWSVLAFVIITCLGTLGINVTSVAAILGATGLAVGLALQGNLGNLASGILLLVFRPFKIGDSVVVAGQAGVVDGIDLFTTNLDTGDNRRIIVPNGAIFGGVIENQTRHPTRVVSVDVAISPAADVDGTRAALVAAASRVVDRGLGGRREPAPAATLASIAPLTWTVALWCDTPKHAGVRQALLIELKQTIEREKLGPAPAVQIVRLENAPK